MPHFRSFLLLSIFLPSLSHALVDMRNANYSENWIDLEAKTASSYDLKLERTYNSRTLFSGMFGFGWCTDFETTLKVTPENTLRVTECGAGFDNEYFPNNYSKDTLNKNIKSIVAELRKREKNRDDAYFKKIEEDLRIDTDLREELAKQLSLTGSVKENSRYVANGRANDYVILKGGEYTRTLPNGTYQKFTKAGRLIQSSDKNGNFIKISYSGDKITSVTDNNGASLQFKYYDNSKFVKQVIGPAGLKASYKYQDENLVEITNAWKNTYKHEYDDLYNMTKVLYPDKTYIALTYNKDRDWVTSFRDRRGCKETYVYTDDEKDPVNNYKSAVEKVCDKKVTNKSNYEFWHKTRADGTRYLFKTKVVNNGQSIETTYHPVFGRPVIIEANGTTSKFDYYANGLLKKKVDPVTTYDYKYDNSCSKVSQVSTVTKFLPPTADGRKPAKAKTRSLVSQFRYEAKHCNLVGAKNSDGQVVSLDYDRAGRIRRIVDQSKKEVNITYEERFGKPHVVTRPGLGSITFRYKSDGSMEKFDSKDDPMVAVQVASIFSNLLEVIAPATTDTSI